jgi:hypothetical protein
MSFSVRLVSGLCCQSESRCCLRCRSELLILMFLSFMPPFVARFRHLLGIPDEGGRDEQEPVVRLLLAY